MSLTRILVIDDEPGVRACIRMLLQTDYDVRDVASGVEALTAAESWRPHLVISDINMPGLDGIETVEAIRRLLQLRELPVIFISGRWPEEYEGRWAAVGAAAYLPKPFSVKELMDLIRRGLGHGTEDGTSAPITLET
jgi:two-component system chemotaxis response regulator CheY